MSGLTTYPRTNGGGGSVLQRFLSSLADLRYGTGVNTERAAATVVETLEAISRTLLESPSATAAEHEAMVRLSGDARNVLFKARRGALIKSPLYQQAMEVSAHHWASIYPNVENTGLRERAEIASARLAAATTQVAVRAAKEEAGTVSWLYQASALLGQDLSKTIAADAYRIPGSRYTEARVDGVLQYLECGASYNVNQYLIVQIPDSPVPLVVVGEAKGGQSGYGEVRGPSFVMNEMGASSISQRDITYARSRAYYMKNDAGATPAGRARCEAGRTIMRAFNQGNIMYLTARGDIVDNTIKGKMEVFICR